MKKVLIGLLVVIGVLAAVIAMQPADFHVERSATVPGQPDVAFALVNDFHAWEHWSPWATLDPNMKNEFSGAENGVGAINTWSGNKEVGQGRQEITVSKPSERIEIDLAFMEPMESKSKVTFTFAPVAEGTKVTWAMDGKNDFMGKGFELFAGLDNMVGPDFEKGLANLKKAAETELAARKKAADEAAAAAAAAAPMEDEEEEEEGDE